VPDLFVLFSVISWIILFAAKQGRTTTSHKSDRINIGFSWSFGVITGDFCQNRSRF
jgi:hypothetical protein